MTDRKSLFEKIAARLDATGYGDVAGYIRDNEEDLRELGSIPRVFDAIAKFQADEDAKHGQTEAAHPAVAAGAWLEAYATVAYPPRPGWEWVSAARLCQYAVDEAIANGQWSDVARGRWTHSRGGIKPSTGTAPRLRPHVPWGAAILHYIEKRNNRGEFSTAAVSENSGMGGQLPRGLTKFKGLCNVLLVPADGSLLTRLTQGGRPKDISNDEIRTAIENLRGWLGQRPTGRKPTPVPDEVAKMVLSGDMSADEAAEQAGVSSRTIRRRVKALREE